MSEIREQAVGDVDRAARKAEQAASEPDARLRRVQAPEAGFARGPFSFTRPFR